MVDKPCLKFLLPPQFMKYDLLLPPGLKNAGSGVGVKYARVEEAGGKEYNCTRIGSTDAVDENGVVFADWLWFCSTPGKSIIDQAKAFIELKNPKVIYGSELSVLGFPQKIVQQLIEGADIITHNTEYQRKLYSVIRVYGSYFLCDPIPEEIFVPSARKVKRLVMVGQTSEAKRSDATVKIFRDLKSSGVETCYIGGSTVWGDKAGKKDSQFHYQIQQVADKFVENATQQEVADIINESAYYAHVARHDVASSSMQENIVVQNIIFGLTHPVLRERTSYRYSDASLLASAVAEYPFETDTHKQDMAKLQIIGKQFTYLAWCEQVSNILRIIT